MSAGELHPVAGAGLRLGRRLGESLAVLLVMSFVVYMLIGLMPGDPIDLMFGADPDVTAEDVQRLKEIHGLDRPLHERYLAWLGNAVQGEFGHSRLYSRPVEDVLLERLGRTLLLMGLALSLALLIAFPLGIIAALRPRGLTDTAVNLLCFAGISVPPFWLALLLTMLFAVGLGWLPSSGMGPVGESSLLERLPYYVLPVLTLTLASVGEYTRFIRASMLEVMRQDFIRTARAKGARLRVVVIRHALRNAVLPVITIVALQFGNLFSGALITETMFAHQGMGKLIYDSILGNDYNLALIGLLFATAGVLIANMVADFTYAAVDPRIRDV